MEHISSVIAAALPKLSPVYGPLLGGVAHCGLSHTHSRLDCGARALLRHGIAACAMATGATYLSPAVVVALLLQWRPLTSAVLLAVDLLAYEFDIYNILAYAAVVGGRYWYRPGTTVAVLAGTIVAGILAVAAVNVVPLALNLAPLAVAAASLAVNLVPLVVIFAALAVAFAAKRPPDSTTTALALAIAVLLGSATLTDVAAVVVVFFTVDLLFVHQLLEHKDTRSIFQFLILNTAFMVVQLVYSFKTGSLGLLSDSLHMALDCTSLFLGLVAGVLSKTPIDPNSSFPFGYSRFETVAGFTNGALLVGISGGVVFEALARLARPVHLESTAELVVVSVAGLAVNLVGIFAFSHGHDHAHGHGHSHDLGSRDISRDQSHDSESRDHSHKHGHSHSHSHGGGAGGAGADAASTGDNMRGIFLHILADTLGSVGVVVLTLLTRAFGWPGFDPVASLVIAVLIFGLAVPLIKSTASELLLGVSDQQRISGILEDIGAVKGVKLVGSPRLWTQGDVVGYVHVQVYRGENTAVVKRRVSEIVGGGVLVQVEFDYEDCWCRTA